MTCLTVLMNLIALHISKNNHLTFYEDQVQILCSFVPFARLSKSVSIIFNSQQVKFDGPVV